MSRARGHLHTGRELSEWNGSEIALEIKPKLSPGNSNDPGGKFRKFRNTS